MFIKLRKLGFVMLFMNIFMIQSLMADMIFYYSAAILPSIIATQHRDPVAVEDYIDGISDIYAVNVDVLSNDTFEGPAIVEFQAGWDPYTGETVYGTYFEDLRGIWQVEANQTITFTPSASYGGGYVWMEYRITDVNGQMSQSWVQIEYPLFIQATYDLIQETNTSITVEYDVVANVQTGNGSSVTELALIQYDNNGQMIYVDSYTSFEGTWSIVDGKIHFLPSENFNGGWVNVEYRVGDDDGHYSQGGFSIEYPLYIDAASYYVNASSATESVTIDVYADSTIPAEGVSSFQFVNIDMDGNVTPLGDNNVNWNGGIWTVNNENVTFEPDSTFSGGTVYIAYMISDSLGHSSVGFIQITYPMEASNECPVTTLNSIDTVYDALTSDLSFTVENGRREFNIELDEESYVVNTDLFDSSTAVSGFNPMYQVKYEEESRMTSSGDTFVKVRLRANILELFDSNNTWTFREPTSENDRGYKFSGIEGEGGGSYVLEDDAYTLSFEGEDAFTFKLVRDITMSEINTVLEDAGITLTLAAEDTAQLLFGTEEEDRYNWWGTMDNEDHGSLNAFIVANEYNSTEQWFNASGVLRTYNWPKVIIFAAGSEGQSSGTLVEIDGQTNTLLTDTAGTWHIETITDQEGDTYNIIVAETSLCGYESKIFRVDADSPKILQGQREEAGTIEPEIWFSSSLKDKLDAYFINEAPLDIDPAHDSSPQINESMLPDGRMFYSVEDQENGETHYRKMTIVSSNQLTRQLIVVNASGDITSNSTETYAYELEEGRIRLQGNGDVKIGLNSEPGAGDWDVTFYTWDSMWTEHWFVNEPSDFPE